MKNMFPARSSFDHIGKKWLMGLGIALIVLSFITLGAPYLTSIAITFIVGAVLIGSGVAYGFHAFQNNKWSGFFFSIIAALINIAAGLLILTYPKLGLVTLTLIFALLLAIQGVIKILASLKLSWADGAFWLLLSGVVSIVLGVLIWQGWPTTAAWVLGLFLSIDLLFAGWAMIFLSSTANRKRKVGK